MEHRRETDRENQAPEPNHRPGVYLGSLASKQLVSAEQLDYLVSAEGFIGFKARNLAKIALRHGDNAVIWIEPVRLPAETDEAAATRHYYAGGKVTIDVAARQLIIEGEPVHLQKQQYKILEYLSENEGEAISIDDITRDIWGHPYIGTRTLAVHISNIRKKLGEYSGLIATVPGTGYLFQDIPADDESVISADQEV